MQKVIDIFKSVDSFGSGVGFSMKGDGTFKTSFGAFLTLIIYVLVLAYGAGKYSVLTNKADTAHQEILRENVVDSNQTFLLSDIEANFAFGLWSNSFTPVHPDNFTEYVYFQALKVSMGYDAETG